MNEEFARAGVPRVTRGMGEWLVGPSIIVWGTDEQKAHFLPRIIDGTDRYCQGFSEPDAGSDLAGLKTQGVVDGDEVVITGQKVWTSGAQTANMMFCLCRTDPDAPKHKGISYVLTPMYRDDGSSNGFELRPIKQMTGSAHFTETFITEARAPLFNVIGGLHDGWRVTMTTLGNERGGNATTQHVQYTKQFWDAVELTQRARPEHRPGRAAGAGVGVHPRRDHAVPGPEAAQRGGGQEGAGAGQLDQQDVLVGVRPALLRADDEHPRRPRRCCSAATRSPTSTRPTGGRPASCRPGRSRSGAAPRRSSATSSVSACSGCRRSRGPDRPPTPLPPRGTICPTAGCLATPWRNPGRGVRRRGGGRGGRRAAVDGAAASRHPRVRSRAGRCAAPTTCPRARASTARRRRSSRATCRWRTSTEDAAGGSRAEAGYNCGLALVAREVLDADGRNPTGNANMATASHCAYVAGPARCSGRPATTPPTTRAAWPSSTSAIPPTPSTSRPSRAAAAPRSSARRCTPWTWSIRRRAG